MISRCYGMKIDLFQILVQCIFFLLALSVSYFISLNEWTRENRETGSPPHVWIQQSEEKPWSSKEEASDVCGLGSKKQLMGCHDYKTCTTMDKLWSAMNKVCNESVDYNFQMTCEAMKEHKKSIGSADQSTKKKTKSKKRSVLISNWISTPLDSILSSYHLHRNGLEYWSHYNLFELYNEKVLYPYAYLNDKNADRKYSEKDGMQVFSKHECFANAYIRFLKHLWGQGMSLEREFKLYLDKNTPHPIMAMQNPRNFFFVDNGNETTQIIASLQMEFFRWAQCDFPEIFQSYHCHFFTSQSDHNNNNNNNDNNDFIFNHNDNDYYLFRLDDFRLHFKDMCRQWLRDWDIKDPKIQQLILTELDALSGWTPPHFQVQPLFHSQASTQIQLLLSSDIHICQQIKQHTLALDFTWEFSQFC
ncbi:hypothetical protein RFI_00337 [Reticulomyxa filosa]|uniref:Uncharacterized protein n=1 Tax=Reticulomyxa filosa TaxID=46433 RepID=X6PDY0_RETFI|nr:hypothetical protein RFI_00337 [Reticulomyxa filosa]|eukprot:ETO36725.1 hypothetical protein RFI_00337 [Reticulomyxa filosa]